MNFTTSLTRWYPGTEVLRRKWRKKDRFEYDSDPEDRNLDGNNHKHLGNLVAVSEDNRKITLKDEEGFHCNYGLEEISIKLPPKGALIQVSDKQWLDYDGFNQSATMMTDIRTKICEIESNERLYDAITFISSPPNNTLLYGERLEMKMKETNKWYLEDKYEKICFGFCNELKLKVPRSLQQIVIKYVIDL